MKHVCSLSGGRTSTGPLPEALIKRYGKNNVEFIFCDTGAEHDDTYRFIQDAEKALGVSITCLKLVMSKEKGVGGTYKVCTTEDIKRDYESWSQLTHKYGNPFIPGGKFCTDQMKTKIFKKYCEDKFGRDGFYTWLGYRKEEGQRIWGRDASRALGSLGMTNTEKTEFYLECMKGEVDSKLDEYYPVMFPNPEDEKQKNFITKALDNIQKKNFRFMSEICLYDKQEVVSWWKDKPSDLKIGEHLGNCVFCPEKPIGTIMLAIKDEPEMAKEYLNVVESEEVAVKANRKKTDWSCIERIFLLEIYTTKL